MDGILRVDKPQGVTSHDVVAWVRRAVGMRAVGHAGTLDPLATGLLVVLLGEATKLSSYLTADHKRYLATVRFGFTTDSLDADGAITESMPPGHPVPTEAAVRDALTGLLGAQWQVPPSVSAIKVDGVAMHARTRRGESVALPPRAVSLDAAELTAVYEGGCDLDVTVSKGFYVRALARDLATALGTLGHLTALRRVRAGALSVDGALPGPVLRMAAKVDPGLRAGVRAAVEPMATAARAMRSVTVDEDAVRALGFGRPVAVPVETPPGPVLVLRADGEPVCVGAVLSGVLSVARGLRVDAVSPAPDVPAMDQEG